MKKGLWLWLCVTLHKKGGWAKPPLPLPPLQPRFRRLCNMSKNAGYKNTDATSLRDKLLRNYYDSGQCPLLNTAD